jgi:hypothetical protein
VFGFGDGSFTGGVNLSDNGRIELVQLFMNIPLLVFEAQSESPQRTLFAKVLLPMGYRQHASQVSLTIGGFITMLARIPGKDPDLVDVERHAVFGLSKKYRILLYRLAFVLDFIQGKGGNNTLPFGILGDLIRNIHVKSAAINPANAFLLVTNQPPVFQDYGLV